MDRTMKYGGHCTDGMSPAEVPIGWQRKIHHSRIFYISPSGSVLACLEQAKSYLLTDGTCKCGLECPLILHKVFNFDPGAAVKQRTAEDAKADSDVTKLCIHKRKIIAVATLHRSMGSQFPRGATGAGHVGSLNHHAERNGPSNSDPIDSKRSYKIPMSGQQHYQRDLGSPPQRELYTARTRSRLGGGEHTVQRSPYRSRHSSLLSPPSSTPCSSQHYGDGNSSPRPDPLRSPDPSALGFYGALSPGPGHMNGERFTPLSPPNIMVHGSPSDTPLQPYCAIAGRTIVSLSPSLNAKSPNRQKSPCSFLQSVDYQHKASAVCYTRQHPPISQLPPCVVQKKLVTPSEKDPLGILDPIPTKSHIQDQTVSTPSSLQFNAQPQVPSMNVNIPPTIVPLPSNLPMPMSRSGPIAHGQRMQNPTPTSVPSSPITSPVHIAGPAPIRVEETSHHSHASISSSQHGSCALTTGLQTSKLPSRSPRTSLPLHHLKETANQLLGGMHAGARGHPDSVCPPGSDGVSQSNHSLGVASHQLLDQQNPSSFPASSLLSAAAKAQLVNQNKLTDVALGTEARASSLGHPGLVGGGRQMYSDGYGISDTKYLKRSGLPLNDSQSGRAALRDKLMAQQREVLRKRKQPGEAGGGMTFSMNSSTSYPEPMKRLVQQGDTPSNTSMVHLLQSMSHQSVQNGLSHAGHHPTRSGKSPFFEESAPQMPALQSVHGPHQLHSRVEIPGCQNLGNECNRSFGEPVSMDQFPAPVNEMHNPGFAGSLGTLGYGGHEAMGAMGNPNPHWQQFGHHVKQSQGNILFRDRTGLHSVMSNGGFNTFSESGKARFLNSNLSVIQEVSRRQQQQLVQDEDPLQVGRFLQSQNSLRGRDSHPDTSTSNPMNSLLQNFQVSFPERVPQQTVISRPEGVSQRGATCVQDSQREYPTTQVIHHRREVNYLNKKAKVGLSRETMPSVITPNSGDAFAASIAVAKLPQSVIQSPLRSCPEESVQHQSRMGPPCKKPEQLNSFLSGVMGAPVRFRSPRYCTQRRQWLRDVEGPESDLWHADKLLQARGQDLNGNGVYAEMLRRRTCPASQECVPSQFNGQDSRNGFFVHMNGGGPTLASVQSKNIQPPGHAAGSEAGEAGFSGDFAPYSGHLNGRLKGNYNRHYNGNLNGYITPDNADGKMSEESLRSAALLCSGQRCQHTPRIQHARELLWGQGVTFHSWPSKLKKEDQASLRGVCQSAQGKVESERFHKTPKDDLEEVLKVNGNHQSGGELNNYLEAAIEDAVSKLNRLTGNRDVKAHKPKRRKISR